MVKRKRQREREETWKELSGDAENAAALFVSAFDLEDVEFFEMVLFRRRRVKVSGHSGKETLNQSIVRAKYDGRMDMDKDGWKGFGRGWNLRDEISKIR